MGHRVNSNLFRRLEQVASGTGVDERIVRLEYDASGYVNKLTDSTAKCLSKTIA